MRNIQARPTVTTPLRIRDNAQDKVTHPLTPTRLNKENLPLHAQTHSLIPSQSPNKKLNSRNPNIIGGRQTQNTKGRSNSETSDIQQTKNSNQTETGSKETHRKRGGILKRSIMLWTVGNAV